MKSRSASHVLRRGNENVSILTSDMSLSRARQYARAPSRLVSITVLHDANGFLLVAVKRNFPFCDRSTTETLVQAPSSATQDHNKNVFID
jgi:hypothetical protein